MQHFRAQGDPQQSVTQQPPRHRGALELRLSLLEPGPGRAVGLHRHWKSPWSTSKAGSERQIPAGRALTHSSAQALPR